MIKIVTITGYTMVTIVLNQKIKIHPTVLIYPKENSGEGVGAGPVIKAGNAFYGSAHTHLAQLPHFLKMTHS